MRRKNGIHISKASPCNKCISTRSVSSSPRDVELFNVLTTLQSYVSNNIFKDDDDDILPDDIPNNRRERRGSLSKIMGNPTKKLKNRLRRTSSQETTSIDSKRLCMLSLITSNLL